MPQSPAARASDNFWPQWPKIHRVDYGHEEAINVWGRDPRSYSIMSKRFLGDAEANVEGIQTIQVDWAKGNNGAPPSLNEIRGTEKEWPAQLGLLALGFLGAQTEGLILQLGVEMTDRGVVAVDAKKMTSRAGIFAAGDIERGPSLFVWAMTDGGKRDSSG